MDPFKDPKKMADKIAKDTQKAVQDDIINRVAVTVSTFWQQAIAQKLTYGYLGIFTGDLRRTSGVQIKKDGNLVRLLVGTAKNYGYAYETGDWTGYVASREYTEAYNRLRSKRRAQPEWWGKRQRPFLKDTIQDIRLQNRINAKLAQGRPLK